MHVLKKVFLPLTILLALLAYPFKLRARRRLLAKHGWAEMWVEGEVIEVRPLERWAREVVQRFLRRGGRPRVVLSRLRAFVDAFVKDRHAKGVLVRLGPLAAGWASADEIRAQLLRIQKSGREVLVFLDPIAGNKEMLVASAATRILMPPSGAIAATGSASQGLFLKAPLDKAGIRVEVAARGRFKSAPEQLTRTERSETDTEQTTAIVKALDRALIDGLVEGGRFDAQSARRLLERAPLVGRHAHDAGFVQGLTHEEDLVEDVQTTGHLAEAPKLVGAGGYLSAQQIRNPLRRKRKKVGIVEVHGAIMDQAPGLSGSGERVAIRKAVVDDLRLAGEDDSIGAVVLHVDSRGGSVTASEAIWAAARRVDQDKPVIACFGDVAASGGYYVACGARAIYGAPLTVTGSIGVFAMLPTWPELARRLGVGHDVIAQFENAVLYDPWRGLDERAKAHADREVGAMYDEFIRLVAEARRLPESAVDEVAQGRVWIGEDARTQQLLDGLGGLPEAMARAKEEAGGRFEAQPVLVRSHRSRPRPAPASAAAFGGVMGSPTFDGSPDGVVGPSSPTLAVIWRLLAEQPGGAVLAELAALSLAARPPFRAVAYAPLSF